MVVGLTEVGQMIRRKRETLKWTQEHLAAKGATHSLKKDQQWTGVHCM